jgi:hypothetical protein
LILLNWNLQDNRNWKKVRKKPFTCNFTCKKVLLIHDLHPKKEMLNYLVKSIQELTFSRKTYTDDLDLLNSLLNFKNVFKDFSVNATWSEITKILEEKVTLNSVIENQVIQIEIENCIFSLRNN